LFVLGAYVGHAVGGDSGMVWGSGIGLTLGLVLAGFFLWLIRRR
jgi:LPXTG-motif cell wall-anchored protein